MRWGVFGAALAGPSLPLQEASSGDFGTLSSAHEGLYADFEHPGGRFAIDGACKQRVPSPAGRRGMIVPGHHGHAVYPAYYENSKVFDGHGKGDDQWLFEYHAPERKRFAQ